jgi:hypothetical protein
VHPSLGRHSPRPIRDSWADERVVKHTRATIRQLARRGTEGAKRDEQSLDRLPLRRQGPRFDLDAKHALRRVGVEMARRGCRAGAGAGADVQEEPESANVPENVEDG